MGSTAACPLPMNGEDLLLSSELEGFLLPLTSFIMNVEVVNPQGPLSTAHPVSTWKIVRSVHVPNMRGDTCQIITAKSTFQKHIAH
jgi:hypothetical protein